MVRADHRLGGGLGGREGKREGELTARRGIRTVELQPDFETIQVYLVKNIKDI